MFRKMRREKQQLSAEECIELLKSLPRGVLSVLGDADYPYGVPMDFLYCEENGHLYFHGSRFGHKIEAMQKHDKVSFCLYDEGFRREGEWSLNIRSVIVFGKVRFIDGMAEKEKICRSLAQKYTDDMEYIEREVASSAAHTLCFELIPEHISGKLVNES